VAISNEQRTHIAKTHIDSDVLRGMLDTTDTDDLCVVGKHLRNSIKKNNPLGVSIPSIGEAFHTLCEDTDLNQTEKCRNAAGMLHKLIQEGKIELVGIGKDKRVYQIAKELMDEDQKLKPADAIILSVACDSNECASFYTTDRVLLDGIKIAGVARIHSVNIQEPPYSERRRRR